ncbi:DUF1672 family protein [Listeria fleischmannii]|nr:DUF1672 family protein [Listeria fleischmannii]
MNGKKIAISIISLSILLGGCSFMGQSDEKEKKADDGTTPVAEYKGQGFIFVDGDKSKEIVEKNAAEIKKRAIAYMKDTYKTNVKVNNVVPARDAAVVMVEAEEPIEFHTSVIVGLDMQKKELDPSPNVWSQDGVVEGAIVSGLYAKAYKEEFIQLDSFTANEAKKYDLEGYNQKSIDKTQAGGYEQRFYYISVSSLEFPTVYKAYLQNNNLSNDSELLRSLFLKDNPDFSNVSISCRYFFKSKGLPKQEEVDKMREDLNLSKGLPKGLYSIDVYKNFIVNRVGLPNGDSTRAQELQK